MLLNNVCPNKGAKLRIFCLFFLYGLSKFFFTSVFLLKYAYIGLVGGYLLCCCKEILCELH